MFLTTGLGIHKTIGMTGNIREEKRVRIIGTSSDFERERLRLPFGFKGGYLTELWQTAVQLRTGRSSGIGLATQSVLYGDAELFATHSEAGANALMFALTEKALRIANNRSFVTPMALQEDILPEVAREAAKLTGKQDLNPNFVLNALVSLDNAAWLLYAAENGYADYDSMIPVPYRAALAAHNTQVGIMFQVSYKMPVAEIEKAVDEGYFIIKIKTGQPGSQREMISKDAARIREIHAALQAKRTRHTRDGRILYTLDCNGRYEQKAALRELIDMVRPSGALQQLLLVEEPFPEANNEDVHDLDVRVAADESANNEANTLRRIRQGYNAIVLKAVAKTLSLTMKIAKLAHEHNIPCFCSDLTVNPVLVDWHKNLAARLSPFPELGMGMMETNGRENYMRWEEMRKYLPDPEAGWTKVKKGVFHLDSDFYRSGGGILQPSAHYEAMFRK